MRGAHYEYDILISHQFSITNITLLLCGCMWTRTLGYIPRHLSRTSLNNNNNKYNNHTTDLTPVLIMIPQRWHDNATDIPTLSNTSCMYSVDGEVRYMVYRWGFPYLDYPLDVLISWIRRLSLYNWFCLHLHFTYDIYNSYMLDKCISLYLLLLPTCFLEYTIHWYSCTCVLAWARYLAFLYSLGCILTTLDLHVQIPEFGHWRRSCCWSECTVEA